MQDYEHDEDFLEFTSAAVEQGRITAVKLHISDEFFFDHDDSEDAYVRVAPAVVEISILGSHNRWLWHRLPPMPRCHTVSLNYERQSTASLDDILAGFRNMAASGELGVLCIRSATMFSPDQWAAIFDVVSVATLGIDGGDEDDDFNEMQRGIDGNVAMIALIYTTARRAPPTLQFYDTSATEFSDLMSGANMSLYYLGCRQRMATLVLPVSYSNAALIIHHLRAYAICQLEKPAPRLDVTLRVADEACARCLDIMLPHLVDAASDPKYVDPPGETVRISVKLEPAWATALMKESRRAVSAAGGRVVLV